VKSYTATGVIDTDSPDPADILLDDIAVSLAGMRRWRGVGVSVSQHSVLMAQASIWSEQVARWCLLHDAAECYLSDVPSPLHHSPGFAAYRRIEARVEAAIAERFGLDLPIPEEVWKLDKQAGRLEAEEYVPHAARGAYPRVKPLEGVTFVPLWSPSKARREFLFVARALGLDD